MSKTYICMAISLLIAVILTLPAVSYWSDYNWGIERMPPISWLGAGLHQMDIFFHEIGHSLFHWFYGKPSIPTFDFLHGGGVAYGWPQNTALIICIHALFLYGVFYFRHERALQISIGAIGLFHLATVYTELHQVVYLFMGHGTAIAIASFFLYRAWFDLAPRGEGERYLNGIIGFGIMFQNILLFWGLKNDEIVRTVYFQQKGGHGLGDFNKISNIIKMPVTDIAIFGIIYACLFLILPMVLYYTFSSRLIDSEQQNKR